MFNIQIYSQNDEWLCGNIANRVKYLFENK